MEVDRGAVVQGPDLFADNDYRPFVHLSDETHPFASEEGIYAAVTTTRRSASIPLTGADFVAGGLPRESYVNPWTVATIRDADLSAVEGHLTDTTLETIAHEAADYILG